MWLIFTFIPFLICHAPGPVHLHPRRAAGGGAVRQHRGARPLPGRPHTEADPGLRRAGRQWHGDGVQGQDLKYRYSSEQIEQKIFPQ